MVSDSYTVIVVPHAKARFRKVQLSLRLTKWAGAAIAGTAAVVAVILVHYAVIQREVRELRHLRAENAALVAKTKEYEQLGVKLRTLQGMVTKLGVMAGLESTVATGAASVAPPTAGLGGITGPQALVPPQESIGGMHQTVAALAAQSSRLETFYRDQTLLLSSTPSIWPVRGYVSAAFGNRLDPFTRQRDFHPGIDISTPIGTRIHAPADGVVVSSKADGGYGNALVVDHGYGVVTRYGHMAGFAVKEGQRVRRGDVLGYVGNTGRSTGPHLHYEVWVRDQAQNPIHFILDEYRTFG